jgi:lytic murein transglycosylase
MGIRAGVASGWIVRAGPQGLASRPVFRNTGRMTLDIVFPSARRRTRPGGHPANPAAGRNSREALRRAVILLLTCAAVLMPAATARAADAAFSAWLAQQWPEAQKMGISRRTFDAVTRTLEPDLSLPDLVIAGKPDRDEQGQPEFVRTPAEYLSEKSLSRLAAYGRQLEKEHAATLATIEKRFGVPSTMVLAIWARETDFGRYKLPHNALTALATQAYTGRRKEQFLEEFLYAIKMVDDGHIKPADFSGSWAGATGLTQFMPSEYYKYAVDLDGDGRANIWGSVPDALASAAKQLAGKGWQTGRRWAYEVRVPKAVDCALAEPDHTLPLGEWLKRGYVPAFGRKPGAAELSEPHSLLLPAGVYGPAFLISKNYFVIKDYNFSDLYVLFVGSVHDRLTEGHGFETPWGKVAQLHTRDLEEMQRRMTEVGLYREKIDGKAGMKTRAALGAYQKTNGLKLDCWPNTAVLSHMRRKVGQK